MRNHKPTGTTRSFSSVAAKKKASLHNSLRRTDRSWRIWFPGRLHGTNGISTYMNGWFLWVFHRPYLHAWILWDSSKCLGWLGIIQHPPIEEMRKQLWVLSTCFISWCWDMYLSNGGRQVVKLVVSVGEISRADCSWSCEKISHDLVPFGWQVGVLRFMSLLPNGTGIFSLGK